MIISGLCIILLLWIPSNQSTTDDTAEKEFLPNHIQITPIRDQSNNDLATNEGRKQKSMDDLVQQANNKQINNLLGDTDAKDPDNGGEMNDISNIAANNVIDNVENIEKAIENMEPVEERKAFKGPTNDRQRAVVAAAKHAWSGYKKYAWGHDNLKPISMAPYDWFGLALTLVDSLDTLYIMNLQKG